MVILRLIQLQFVNGHGALRSGPRNGQSNEIYPLPLGRALPCARSQNTRP